MHGQGTDVGVHANAGKVAYDQMTHCCSDMLMPKIVQDVQLTSPNDLDILNCCLLVGRSLPSSTSKSGYELYDL